MDISLRHLPDLSDVSAAPDLSDASFQIPVAAGSSSKLLLAEDGLDFLNVDDTLASPVKTPRTRSRTKALTLAELTPRSKLRSGGTPARSSRKRPAIPSPLKQAVASDLSTAMEDALSPFKRQDYSFQIPAIGRHGVDLLMDDDTGDFFGNGVHASLLDEPASPRAREPLTLSQLTPGPKITRSNSPAKATIGLLSEAVDENATPSQSSDQQLDDASGGQMSSFSNLQAEIETFLDTRGEGRQDSLSPSPLAPHSTLIAQSIDDEGVEHADGAVEVRAAAPHTAKFEPAVPDGVANETDSVHDKMGESKPDATNGGRVEISNPAPATSSLTLDVTLPKRKPNSQPRPSGRANVQAFRNEASRLRANAAAYESPDAGTASCDTTMSEAGGLAAALVSYGQKKATVVRSAKTANSKLKSDRIVPHADASTSVVKPVLKREVLASDTKPPSTNVQQLSAPGADALPAPTLPHDPSRAQAYVSPNEDEDVNMIEAHSPATNTDNQFESSAETSTPAYPAVPPSPMRTSTKRSASAVSEDHPPQPAPQRKRAKILPVIAESSGPSQNQVRKAKVTTRATRGVKKTVRPRRKPAVAAAAQARFSPSESGAGISRSAAERSGKQTNKLGLASSSTSRAPTTNTGDVRSRAAHAHMTRSQTRSLSHASTSSASSSTASRSGGANLGNPCDADTGRQVPPWDDSKSTGNTEGRGHLATKRSRLNEPDASLPPAKPTKPMEFHFESDARLEARRTGFAERAGSSTLRRSQQTHAPIPDFKALHESQARVLAAKREQIVPVHPQEFQFSTEARAHEREKFEEARRAREEEAERALEERRRLEALEEEKEIRELRRRAVPKANEVPEWYALAPKRSHETRG